MELKALPYMFDFWALPHQIPPEGDWRSWLVLGGRGAGKTRAGAEWVRQMVEGPRPRDKGRARRLALIGETYDAAREVMVFGESGILACSPSDRRPDWQAGRRMLVWPNGAVAQVFSASDPEALRGPQFDAAWADEFAKWPKVEETWDMLSFSLRLGAAPQVCVTTTPRDVPALHDLMAQPSTVTTHAPTRANRANLSQQFIDEVERRYAGTAKGRQELEGELLSEVEGALWTGEMIAAAQVDTAPELERIVVAVDPSVSGKRTGDACGIVVAGACYGQDPAKWRAWVLEDATVPAAKPMVWARAALKAFETHKADRLIAEVNQGGALVETVLRQIDPHVPFSPVHATRGKSLRAEPVAALYEQGKVFHLRGMGELEGQMTRMTARGFDGGGSPDRVDALVWALHALLIAPGTGHAAPSLRMI